MKVLLTNVFPILTWFQKTVPVVLQRETEFLLFLEELQKDISEEVLKVSYFYALFLLVLQHAQLHQMEVNASC